MRGITPGARLIAAVGIYVAVVALTLAIALDRPSIGVRLEPTKEGRVALAEFVGPRHPAGTIVVAIESARGREVLSAQDLLEEPDAFDSLAEMDAFFASQSRIAGILEAPEVVLVTADAGLRFRPVPRRPLGSLPFGFVFQIGVGSAGFLIGALVLVLRPRDRATRLFAALGLAFLGFTAPAAIYSTRELAIDGGTFRALSAANQAGAFAYGCFLVALFLSYPRRLVPARWLLLLPVVYLPLYVAGQARLVDTQDLATRLPVMSQMTIAIVLAAVQWRATRGDPRDRAALRWFGLALIVGSGLFVSLTIASRAFGFMPPLPQGYAFGFFLLMDVGLALGLRRYRLFELEEWSFRVAFWLGAGIAFLMLDVALAAWLHLGRGASSSIALVLCALVYLPVRSTLWARLAGIRRIRDADVFPAIVAIAFARGDEERSRRWLGLLRATFDPLTIGPDESVAAPRLVEDGLGLVVPSVGSSTALRLAHPSRGLSLFGPRDVELVTTMVALMRDADASRDAYERGAREERTRIARDLHDDVGASLVTGLHRSGSDELQESIRKALVELRSIVGTLSGESVVLASAVADLRRETADRLAAAEVALVWSDTDLPSEVALPNEVARHLASAMREAVTNVLKHARATRVEVRVAFHDRRVIATVDDDGVGLPPHRDEAGRGLGNLTARAAKVGGAVRFVDREPGLRVEIELPMEVVS